HFFTQMPHPIHRNSDMNAILSVGFTSIHSLPSKVIQKDCTKPTGVLSPIFTTGHDCPQTIFSTSTYVVLIF
ncbi:hypothetical protein PISMIDRAFT_105733, partial [Pisolithus microcarpus 441]